jgi:hypothetical protein
MRYDLQEEIWRLERGLDGGVIGRLVLVTHGPGGHPHGTIVERADQRIDLGAQRRLRQFLWKAPKLASAGDRGIVVQEHTMRIAALAAAEGHRNHLAGFGVIAEAGRIRHADKLVFDDRYAVGASSNENTLSMIGLSLLTAIARFMASNICVEPTDMPCRFARRAKISIGFISAAPESTPISVILPPIRIARSLGREPPYPIRD